MADKVNKIGAGWGGVPQGSAEFALRQIIEAGELTGEAVIAKLNADGYSERGPAYYPVENGRGPFYALGNPHTYTSIESLDGEPVWNLTGFDPATAVISIRPGDVPTPTAPPAAADNTAAQLAALVARVDALVTEIHETSDDAQGAILDRIAAAQEAIQTQIDQVVKNAEATGKTLLPIVEAALPALSGLFARK